MISWSAIVLTLGVNASSPVVDVCWGYGCKEQARVAIPPAEWINVVAAFEHPPAPTPAAERDRIARAIAHLEQAVGPVTGTDANLGGNLAGSGLEGQMDCIDESRNTSAYLELLHTRGLLRWHRPAERVRRAPLIFNQHWTAVLVEHDNGRAWAIDSWFHDNGSLPFIVELDEWRRGARP